MNTKTEARNEIQEPVAPQVSGIDSNDQDRQHHGGLWVLAVALVAFAGLAAAVAIEVFDGSNANDAVTTVFVDPRLDSDFHRTPGQLSPKDPIPVETDNDTYLRISGQLSPTAPIPVETDNDTYLRISGQLSPTDASEPAIDKDFQREANQAASQEAAPLVRPLRLDPTTSGAVRIRASARGPLTHQGQPLDPPAGPRAGNRPAGRTPVRSAGPFARGAARPPRSGRRPTSTQGVPGSEAMATSGAAGAVQWPVLGSIPEAQVRALLSVARRRRFDRHEVVFHEGDPGDTVHLIARGRVALRVTTPLGDTVTLRILGPGSLFGELAVLDPAPRNATVVALERTETLALHRDHFDELRQQHPEVDRMLLDSLISEVRRLSTQLLEALYVPVPQRVELRLLDLVRQYGGDGDGAVDIPLTQDELAELSGTSRTTVNRVLSGLEADGLVTVSRGHVVVPEPDRLRRGRRASP